MAQRGYYLVPFESFDSLIEFYTKMGDLDMARILQIDKDRFLRTSTRRGFTVKEGFQKWLEERNAEVGDNS